MKINKYIIILLSPILLMMVVAIYFAIQKHITEQQKYENPKDYLKYFTESINEDQISVPLNFDLVCTEGSARFVIVEVDTENEKTHSLFLKTDKETKKVTALNKNSQFDWVKLTAVLLVDGDTRQLFYIGYIDEKVGKFNSNDGLVPNLGISSPDAHGPYWSKYKKEGTLVNNFAVIPLKDGRWYDAEAIHIQTQASLNYGYADSNNKDEDKYYSKVEHFDPAYDIGENFVELELKNCKLK